MACIEKIYSVSALTGNGKCNGKCKFCAARNLRNAPIDEANYAKNLEAAIKLSARYGGWSLSLTSAGEPTCDTDAVTKTLAIYEECANQGAYFPNVNLFTNGIKIADWRFSSYLKRWKAHGLTNVAVSVHDIVLSRQADAYGLKKYPTFDSIFNNIREAGLGVRVTLLLSNNNISNSMLYAKAVDTLIDKYKINNITSWPIANPDATPNGFTPSPQDLAGIRGWLAANTKLCHGHEWGGGVYDYHGNILRFTDYVTPHDPEKDYVRQLVVFRDGTVCYSWIKEGALCMK